MNSDEPNDKTFTKEGGKEKSEEKPVSEDMYVLSDTGNVGKQEVTDEILAAELNECGLDFLRLGKLNEAIVSFDKAISKDPNNIYLLNNKAAVLETLGRYEEAIELYNKAIKINPEDPDLWNNIAFPFPRLESTKRLSKPMKKLLR